MKLDYALQLFAESVKHTEWITQAEAERRAELNTDPSGVIYYEPERSDMSKVKRFTIAVYCLAVLGLVLAAVLGAYSS
jgi:hypothetical protein